MPRWLPILALIAALLGAYQLFVPHQMAQAPACHALLGAQNPGPVIKQNFRLTPRQAIRAARRAHGLPRSSSTLPATAVRLPGRCWNVDFRAQGVTRARVALTDSAPALASELWTGAAIAERGARDDGPAATSKFWRWYVAPLLALLLLAVFAAPRLRALANLDLLVLVSFIAGAWIKDRSGGTSQWGIALSYLPLVYFLGRFAVGQRFAGAIESRLSLRGLALAVPVLLGARIGLDLTTLTRLDVADATVTGAHLARTTGSIYASFPAWFQEGATYGPLAYYAYLPFEWLAPLAGYPTTLPAAHLGTIFFDLVCVAGLARIGWCMRGTRGALELALFWLLCPWTTYALLANSNDLLMGAIVIWTLALAHRPLARGALLGAAVMTKFAPLALAGALAAPGASAEKKRQFLYYALGLALALALLLGPSLYQSGPGGLWDATLGYQAARDKDWSIWRSIPMLQPLAILLVLALAALGPVLGRGLRLAPLAALCGFITTLELLAANYWLETYIVWIVPFVILTTATGAVTGAEPDNRSRKAARAALFAFAPLVLAGALVAAAFDFSSEGLLTNVLCDCGARPLPAGLVPALIAAGLAAAAGGYWLLTRCSGFSCSSQTEPSRRSP